MKKNMILIFYINVIILSLSCEEIVTLHSGSKAILHDDHTWAVIGNEELSPDVSVQNNRQFLRKGIQATETEIITACEMYEQGWRYTMPRPKSAKAAWGVTDGRTTWFNGWWFNSKNGEYSDSTPRKSQSGLYLGDGQKSANTWRNGESPLHPDVFMFLLSEHGGPG